MCSLRSRSTCFEGCVKNVQAHVQLRILTRNKPTELAMVHPQPPTLRSLQVNTVGEDKLLEKETRLEIAPRLRRTRLSCGSALGGSCFRSRPNPGNWALRSRYCPLSPCNGFVVSALCSGYHHSMCDPFIHLSHSV